MQIEQSHYSQINQRLLPQIKQSLYGQIGYITAQITTKIANIKLNQTKSQVRIQTWNKDINKQNIDHNSKT